ncbi:MAG: imidazolonepropionase, partial [Acidobacteria bacterium]|nr:imidazolonepropionase [Acidobacteriota bacterium]
MLTNIGELLSNDPALGDQSPVGRLVDAALVVDDERVLWVGRAHDAPDADERYDAAGASVVPGFVDSHTHLVFAGERSREFEARMAGVGYDAGGIAGTVEATRAASDVDLRRQSDARLAALRAAGVTTVEIKSGYALDVAGEARLVAMAGELTEEVTFLGAHVVPREYAGRRDAYVEVVAGEMLRRCAAAQWTDVFCDEGAFDVDEARVVLRAGRAAGHQLRLHANQIRDIGAIALATDLDCASVDHCTHVSDDDVERLAGSATVATLLPGAEFSTRSPYPSGRRLLDAGVTVALATDCNPGTSYVTSMSFVIALAVREMGMSVDEAVWS